MATREIFGTVGGYLFNPAGIIARQASEPSFTMHVKSFLFVVLVSVLQGACAFYIIFYPEPLYYGLGPSTPHAHLYVIEQSNPLLLAGLVILLLLFNAVYFHGFAGSLNYLLSRWLSRGQGTTPSFRAFMTRSGYGFMPLLLTIPLASFRFFFLGRISFNNHDFPFFDMTVPNSIYIVFLGLFYAWMFVVQAKINRAMFNGLGWRASIPPLVIALVTCVLLVIIAVVLPPVLNTLVYTIIDE
nr:hypothetical protein [Candidatus Sigynarchaeota archaeon]